MFPIFWLLSQHLFITALIGEIIFALLLGSIASVIFTIVAESFPTEIRNTAVTLAYNSTFAIFGGTAPLIAVFLVHLTESSLAPAFYAMIGVIIAIFSVSRVKETYKKPLLKTSPSFMNKEGQVKRETIS
jgi:MFS family permease